MADGHLNKCKECAKKDSREHGTDKDYDKRRSMLPHRVNARKLYAQTPDGIAAHSRASNRWGEINPQKKKAIETLNNALRDGKLKKWPLCALPECCGKPQAHHPDYDQPFAVVWLCSAHHKQAHALIGKHDHKTI